MLKAILQIVLTLVLGYAAHQFLPFWAIALVAGVVALFFTYRTSWTSFSAGLIAAFLLWCAYAVTLNMENEGLLAGKLADLFSVDAAFLPYASGLIGGLLGGFGALTGNLARKLFS